jgi:hypothetical protein
MSSQKVGRGRESSIFSPPHGFTGIGRPRVAGKVFIVFNFAQSRASASLSARMIIGSGLHFFHIGSVRFVGVSFQMRIQMFITLE